MREAAARAAAQRDAAERSAADAAAGAASFSEAAAELAAREVALLAKEAARAAAEEAVLRARERADVKSGLAEAREARAVALLCRRVRENLLRLKLRRQAEAARGTLGRAHRYFVLRRSTRPPHACYPADSPGGGGDSLRDAATRAAAARRP